MGREPLRGTSTDGSESRPDVKKGEYGECVRNITKGVLLEDEWPVLIFEPIQSRSVVKQHPPISTSDLARLAFYIGKSIKKIKKLLSLARLILPVLGRYPITPVPPRVPLENTTRTSPPTITHRNQHHALSSRLGPLFPSSIYVNFIIAPMLTLSKLTLSNMSNLGYCRLKALHPTQPPNPVQTKHRS